MPNSSAATSHSAESFISFYRPVSFINRYSQSPTALNAPASPDANTTQPRPTRPQYNATPAATATPKTQKSTPPLPPRGHNAYHANQPASCPITPTTAADTAAKAPRQATQPRHRSTYGAPTRINKNVGTKVTHVVITAPQVAADQGDSPPGCAQPARNPTCCSTKINGPGVVSASASPSAICGAVTQ